MWLVFNYSVSFMKFKRFIGFNYVTFAIQTHCYARINDVCAVGMCVQEGDHRNIIKGKDKYQTNLDLLIHVYALLTTLQLLVYVSCKKKYLNK